MRFVFALLLVFIFSAQYADARPVSYPEGWTVMVMNDVEANSSHVHYSPSAQYSVGWRHEYLRDAGAHVDSAQLNNLIKRWNKPGEQANLYLKSGVGVAYESGDFEPAAFTGVASDWETRRYFISYENRFFHAGDVEKFVKHKARVGVAPYIGDYGDLHTWIMVQGDYDAGAEDSFSATPLVRFFKGPAMLEAGYNLDNGIQLNYIHRF